MTEEDLRSELPFESECLANNCLRVDRWTVFEAGIFDR